MKNEIKEILDLLKYCVEKNEYLEVQNMKEWKPLLDYITNLQEENEKLKEDKDSWHRVAQKNYNEMQDKIDKAIEYIKGLCYIESENEWFTYGDDLSPEHIVNILQGEDKDVKD